MLQIQTRHLVLLVIVLMIGCDSPDARLADYAQTATKEQSLQNSRMADLQQDVAAGSRELVAAEAEMRASFTTLQKELQAQASEIARQRDNLEAERQAMAQERRVIAKERQWDSLIAAAIKSSAEWLLCLLPLAITAYLLWPPNKDAQSQAAAEILIEDFVAVHPRITQAIPRITGPSDTSSTS